MLNQFIRKYKIIKFSITDFKKYYESTFKKYKFITNSIFQ
jgi:hypothetical protein